MSDFSQHVDMYCERLDPSFWAEPLNAITNVAFVLAGLFALGTLRRLQQKDWHIATLGILTVIVGIGSFIFHTVATKGTILADVIPIILFIHFALFVIFIRVFGAKPVISVLCVIAFAIVNAVILNIFGRTLFNGSIMYLPTLVMLLIIAIYAFSKKQNSARDCLISALAFLFSMICRSIDQKICAEFPLGTHFMWHILNAVTMYYVMNGLRYRSREA